MIHFPSETNGKLMVLGVPILRHFRVFDTGLSNSSTGSNMVSSVWTGMHEQTVGQIEN